MATKRELLERKRELLLARKRAAETAPAAVPEASTMSRIADVAKAPFKGGQQAINFGLDTLDRTINLPRSLKQAADAAGVSNKYTDALAAPGEAIRGFMGDDLAIKYTQPEDELTPGERALRTGGEWVGGMMAGPGGAARNAALGVKAGLGAAAGEAVGGTPGEIAGGIAATVLHPWRGVQKAGQLLSRARTKKDPATDAVNLIKEFATDKTKALAALDESIARGEQGTLGMRTQDPGIQSLEQGLRSQKGNPMANAYIAAEDAVNEQALSQVREVAKGGDPSKAMALPRARARGATQKVSDQAARNTARAETQAQADIAAREAASVEDLAATQARTSRDVGALEGAEQTATAEARAAANKVATPDSAATASEALRAEVDVLEEAAKATERAAWDAVPKNLGVSGKSIRENVDNFIKHTLSKTERSSLRNNHGTTLKYIDELGDNITPQEAAVIRTKVREAREAAFGKSVSQSDAVALNKIEDKVISIIEKSHAGPEWKRAVAATRAHREKFGSEGLGKALAKPAAETAGEVVKPGPRGVEGLRKLEAVDRVGPTKLTAAVENDLRVRFKQAMEGSAKKAEDFLTRDYRDTLEKFPKLRDEFADAVGKRIEAETVSKAARPAVREELAASGREMAGLERATGRDVGEIQAGLKETTGRIADTAKARQAQVKASPLGKFGRFGDDATSANKAVEEVLSSADAPRAAEQLIKNAQKGGAEQVTALKSAFREALANRILNEGGRIKNFSSARLKKVAPAFKKVFTNKEMDQMEDGIRRAEKMFKDGRISAADMADTVGPVFDVIVSLIGAKAGAFSFGSPLIGANLGRSKVRDVFIKTPRKELLNMVADVNINPEKYRVILNEAKAATTLKEYGKVFDDWQRVYAAGSQTGDEQ